MPYMCCLAGCTIELGALWPRLYAPALLRVLRCLLPQVETPAKFLKHVVDLNAQPRGALEVEGPLSKFKF